MSQAPKLTIVLSPPRCASMWMYNAVRLSLRGAGYGVFPETIAFGQDQLEALFARAAADRDPQSTYVLKSHLMIDRSSDGVRSMIDRSRDSVRIVTVLRDPRDMVVSLNAFLSGHPPQMGAADMIASLISFYDHLDAAWPDVLHKVDYRDVVARPQSVIAGLRAFLNLAPDADADAQLADTLSHDAVKRIIAAAERRPPTQHPSPYDLSDRALDPTTGFQTGHIADGATG
ncbi:MAG: sulfotransferase domain-containing protein [Pseudomonadota bacterium]